MFEDLKHRDEAQSRRLVLVYLPQRTELKGDGPKAWTEFLQSETQALGITLINVFDAFRTLPDAEVVQMYIPDGIISFPAAAGHLTAQGNQLVAKTIYATLKNEDFGLRSAKQ